MAFTHTISRIELVKEDGVTTGAIVGLTCTDSVTDGSAYVDWAIPLDAFASWPPTKAQVVAYIKAYMQTTPKGATLTRWQQLKAQAARKIPTYTTIAAIINSGVTE